MSMRTGCNPRTSKATMKNASTFLADVPYQACSILGFHLVLITFSKLSTKILTHALSIRV